MTGLQFALLATADSCTDALVSMLHRAFGAESVALVACALTGGRLPDCLLRHTLEGSCFDLSPLLLADVMKQAAPALTRKVDPDRLSSFELHSSLLLSGAIAEALAAGGPTGDARVESNVAHRLANDWIGALTDHRYGDIVVLHSRSARSAWFGCEVWDRTWVIADCATSRVWLLSLTGHTASWLPRNH
jgi:hypothetical protein